MHMQHVRLIAQRLASTEGLQEALFAVHAHEAWQLQEEELGVGEAGGRPRLELLATDGVEPTINDGREGRVALALPEAPRVPGPCCTAGRRWSEISDEEEEMSEEKPSMGRRSSKCAREPPVVLGFDAMSFATEWGSRWVQETIERSPADLQRFASVCRGKVEQLATDVHAHHALRAALRLLARRRRPCPFSEPLIEELSPRLARHVYGCRVVIAALAYDGGSRAAARLADDVLREAGTLVLHRFGAHCLQAALWHRSCGSRCGLEAASAALREALSRCRQPWSLSCVETGLEVRLPGLAAAVALSEVASRGRGSAARVGVLRWVMRDVEARDMLLARLNGAGCAPWLIIGELLGRAPRTYVERASASKRGRNVDKPSVMDVLFGKASC